MLTAKCVATTGCVVMWIVVTDVLTSLCGAGVRAEGRCGCAGSADVLTAKCVATTVCVVVWIVVTVVLTGVCGAAVRAEG